MGGREDKKDLIDKIIKRYEHKKFIFNNLLSGYSKRIFTWEKGVSRITGEIESQEDEFQGFPFMFWNRTRREIALLMHMKNYKTRIFTPYLNRDLIDYLFQVNPENFKNNDFHNSAINLISGKVLPGCSRSVAFEDDEKNAEKYIRKKAIKNLVYIESYANKKYINNMWVMPRIAKGALKTNDVGYTQMIIDMVLWFSRLQNLQNKK
ncbi:hypothetical protein [Thiohalophilus sp.]|uniref:hypothetical protein n=1 Tax=Thiohalophilus sp. TaxID=3028392 RepID=UPI002ACEBC05|nr:hypothetical protein [Thiohalophilus sp.]MDZ7803484.1 hypothetical protein [Thiohalophilus sp.]